MLGTLDRRSGTGADIARNNHEQKVIAGSAELRRSVRELYSLMLNEPLIVSVRSGILDLLSGTPANMFVVLLNN